jgi:hypothetical protein
MAYTYAQLKALWIQNGGNPAAADVAAAVALAESGGNPDASNTNTNGSIDRGLWQINSVHGAQSTFDVTGNVKSAISISGNGANWSPWVTYQTGAYKKFMSPTTAAATNTTTSTPSASTASFIPGLSVSNIVQDGIKAFLGMFGLSDLKDMLERAGLIILGFALVILGIKLLGQEERARTVINNQRGGGSKESKPAKETSKAAEGGESVGASEAVEAAAVA